MKIETEIQLKKFDEIKLTLTIENREELEVLLSIGRLNFSVPQLVAKDLTSGAAGERNKLISDGEFEYITRQICNQIRERLMMHV